jgi:hypothetical protein
MTHVNTHAGRLRRLRALALLVVLVGACNEADNLTSTSSPEIALDSVANDSTAADSAAADSLVADSLAVDSLAADSLAVDSLSQLTPTALLTEGALYARKGMPYGPSGLWQTSASPQSRSIGFSASTNFTYAGGLVKQINAARAMGHRLVLNMTGGSHAKHKSNGKFDLRKWKATMNTYNRRDIKAAVARGVADGTVILNSVMDEPNVDWGGNVTKPLLDQMARYVKAMFPTLPVGVALRYDWRPHEKFRVMDAYITQYSWGKGPLAPWRSKVLDNARSQGMKVMFAVNILNGGPYTYKNWNCPSGTTGGRGTYKPTCRMTPSQLRQWGSYLGASGCGLLLWRYDRAFMSKSANVSALRNLASTMSRTPGRSCRRS